MAAAGSVAALSAVSLAAAAFGRDISPYALAGSALGHGARAWLLVLGAAVLLCCIWLVLRHGDARVWIPAEAGGVLIPKAALERIAEEAIRRDPEVVAARVELAARGGELRGKVAVYARPLADAGRLAREAQDAAGAALYGVVGAAPRQITVRVHVLAVRRLKRYLP